MNKVLIFLLLLCVTTSAFSQFNRSGNFIYEVLSNDPRMDPGFTINLEIIHGQFAPNNYGFNSPNIGLWGVAQPGENWGIDYLARMSYISMANGISIDSPVKFQLEFGGYYLVWKNVKQIKTRLVTHWSSRTQGNVEYITKGVARKIPTNLYKTFGFRGGYQKRQSGLLFDESSPLFRQFDYLVAQYNSDALYGGLLLRHTMNTYIQSSYGKQSNAKVIELYGDLMHFLAPTFVSVSGGSDYKKDITENVEEYSRSTNSFGWRLGLRSYQVERFQDGTKSSRGNNKSRPLFNGFSFEFGSMPYTGLYLGSGVSFTIIKRNRSVNIPLE